MIALDTNVLVRVLVDDPGQRAQVKAARDRVRRAKEVFIPQIVQAETVWVLESAYDLGKTEVLMVLEQLLQNKAFVLQHESAFQSAVAAYRKGNADFADYLIVHESQAANTELLTFDKRLAKATGVHLLPS